MRKPIYPTHKHDIKLMFYTEFMITATSADSVLQNTHMRVFNPKIPGNQAFHHMLPAMLP